METLRISNIKEQIFHLHKTAMGMCHTIFLAKDLPDIDVVLSELHSVNGYLKYHFLFSGKSVVGVLFKSVKSITTIQDKKLKVKSPNFDSAVEDYKLQEDLNLEKTGLLIYTFSDSSSLVIPTSINAPLIVTIDHQS